MKKRRERLILKMGGGFAFIAVWQILAFVLLILLVWANELLDFSALLFGTVRQTPNVTEGCLGTAGVLLAAVIVVGNTYLQQRRIVHGLLTICSYCKKIRVAEQAWQQIEEFIGRRSAINFTHSICPECLARTKQQVESATAAPR